MADHWRLTCSCGKWRGYTETDLQARGLAAEHRREQGAHVVTVESRDDHRHRNMGAQPQYLRSI